MECILQIVDNDCNDAKSDIYLCKNWKCNKYHKFYGKERLVYAIYYLEIDRVKELINESSKEELLNFHEIKTTNYQEFLNILEYIFLKIDSYYKSTREPCFNLIKHICKIYPEFITNKLIKGRCYDFIKNMNVLQILRNNMIDNENDDEQCIICFSSNKNLLINNTCSCKNKIHLDCLTNSIKHNINNDYDICKTCETTNNCVIDEKYRFLFPNKNIYRQPLLSNYVFIDENNKKEQLFFAIIYLQTKTVENILNNMTSDEFIEYRKWLRDITGIHRIKNDKLVLADNLYSNLSKDKHKYEYDIINALLASKQDEI